MITPSFQITATERVLPKLALDFTTANLDSRITFTRTNDTATVINSSGALVGVNANIPRFDYNPTTLACRGLLIEEARTNGIRNNTMQGAVTGSPGTQPTNWAGWTSTVSGVVPSIVEIGNENGIDYIDVNFAGTASASTTAVLAFETSTQIAATVGQTWTESVYIKLLSGTIPSPRLLIQERSAAGASLAEAFTSPLVLGSGNLLLARNTFTYTTLNASTAYIRPCFRFSVSNGVAYDFTIRVGLPQMELGAFATSVIKTTSAAATRNADVATMTGTNFSDWWTATSGASDIWLIPKSTSTLAYMSFDDNTANNSIIIANSTTSGQSTITSNGSLQSTLTAGTITVNATNKVGCSWNTNNCAATANGTSPAITASATIPTVTQLRIGSNGTAYANAWIQKLFYWPQRITNNEIQAFTK